MRGNPGVAARIQKAAVLAGVVLAAAGSLALAGCGTGGGGGQDPAGLPRPSCGTAITHFLDARTQVLHAGRGALACFARAARHCTPASVAVTVMGVDTGTDYVFAIKAGTTRCQVTEYRQAYSANFGGSQGPVRATTCHRAAVTPAGVTLRCASRNILIPATLTAALRALG
jgi:hypothetical protein